MKLRTLSLRGLTTFRQPVSIDFSAFGPGLVALVGPNGAGKTTLLESPLAALYKQLPSRPGSLYNYAHDSDAYVEATFEDQGHVLTARVLIDAERRSTEGYLFLDGRPITDGKALSYDAEVLQRFGSLDLLLSSAFSCQTRRGSFLDASKGERKCLFAELLGLGHLDALAVEARDRAARAEGDLTLARARRADIERELAALAAAPEDLAAAEQAAAAAERELDIARAAERAATAALERARSAGERLAALASAELAARHALTQADRAHQDAAEGPRKARARADERRRFVAQRRVEDLEPAARRRHDATMRALGVREADIDAALAGLPAAGADVLLAEALARAEVLRAAEADAAMRTDALERAQAAAESAARALDRATAARDAAVADLERRAELLGQVPCTQSTAWGAADVATAGRGHDLAGTCPLLADARTARERAATARDAEIPELAAAQEALLAVSAAEEAVEHPEAGADRRQAIAACAQRIAELQADVGRLAGAAALRAQRDGLAADRGRAAETLAAELAAAREAIAEAADQLLQIDSDWAADHDRAQAALAAADAELGTARAAHAAATEALDRERAAGAVSIGSAERACQESVGRTCAAEQAARTAVAALAAAMARVQRASDLRAAVEAAAASVQEIETDMGDWRLLAAGLGKDGVQALEVDAAAPEVAGLCNELLLSCYGPRFSLKLETLREKRSARGEYSEVFDVTVFDGAESRPVEALSGGEKVVVGEALGLAISIYSARKNSVRWETIFRDETAGALDPVNAEAYVRMLRRARELGSFHHLLFIAHQPEVWQAADAVVRVADGQVSVEGQRRAA